MAKKQYRRPKPLTQDFRSMLFECSLYKPDQPIDIPESDYDGIHRTFRHIRAGRYSLSIQASCFHYSRPRRYLSVNSYTKWEMAIFRTRDDAWCFPRTVRKLLMDYAESMDGSNIPARGEVVGKRAKRLSMNRTFQFMLDDPDFSESLDPWLKDKIKRRVIRNARCNTLVFAYVPTEVVQRVVDKLAHGKPLHVRIPAGENVQVPAGEKSA